MANNKNKNPLGKEHTQLTRDRIQVQKLVDRLQKFAFATCHYHYNEDGRLTGVTYEAEDGSDITLSKEQIRSHEILLNKKLPNLSSQTLEHSGAVGQYYIPVTKRKEDPGHEQNVQAGSKDEQKNKT